MLKKMGEGVRLEVIIHFITEEISFIEPMVLCFEFSQVIIHLRR